jgi:CubicO group peptidase (beta-lactamase class C family)
MRLKSLFFALFLACAFISEPAFAIPVGDKVFEQAALNRVAREDGFSRARLVARGDQILLRRAAGFAERARKIPNTPDTQIST